MAQGEQRPPHPASTAARRSWFWPVISVVVLLAIAAALASVARQYYDNTAPETFASVLASNLLQGAVIVIGAAVIAALLGLIQEMRAKRERDMAKRLELFRRMRAAHVSIARAQKLLRADNTPGAYAKQMRALMAVARDLEEVREEVKVSGHLYKRPDRYSIMEGIALIIKFLEQGSIEYVEWRNRSSGPTTEPRGNPWLADLITVRKSPGSELDPSNEDWAPNDMMPENYENGLTKSKLKMRVYVYGTPIPTGVQVR
jgi:hypothetical protein